MLANEKEEARAYELMKRMSQDILDLEVVQPTVEYTNKKRYLMYDSKPVDPQTKPITVAELFEQQNWDKKLYKKDLLVWAYAEDPYLPYLYGYTENVHKTVFFSKHAYTQGLGKLLTRLSQIYKVLVLRNQGLIDQYRPRVIKIEKPWQDSIPTQAKSNKIGYFRVDKTVYITYSLHNAYCPSYHYINPKKKGIAHYYTIEDKDFMFIPVTSNISEIKDIGIPVNITSLFTGNGVWPIGLDKLLIPMMIVENFASSYPLFTWLVRNKYQSNRGQNFYLVKPNDYVTFYDQTHKSVPIVDEGTIVYKGQFYGDKYKEVETGLFNIEMKARAVALENWEDYEEL